VTTENWFIGETNARVKISCVSPRINAAQALNHLFLIANLPLHLKIIKTLNNDEM
jgi:hypothetical protein